MWTADYFVRYVSFPHSVHGVTLPNDDGTFDIYINENLSDERRKEALEHEIAHIKSDHFYKEGMTIRQIENAADGLPAACETVEEAPGENIKRGKAKKATQKKAEEEAPIKTKKIPLYASPSAYLAHLIATGEFQRGIDVAHAKGLKIYGIDDVE